MKTLFSKDSIYLAVAVSFILFLSSCGKAYFPIEFNKTSRDEREKGQEKLAVELFPMTKANIRLANAREYERKIIDAVNLYEPARLITADKAIQENLPTENDPGLYVIEAGDIIKIQNNVNGVPVLVLSRVVPDDGIINIFSIGKIKVGGVTQPQLEDELYEKLIAKGLNGELEIQVTSFFSKKVFVNPVGQKAFTIPYSNKSIFIEDVLSQSPVSPVQGSDTKITILRKNQEFVFSLNKILKKPGKNYRIYPDDKIIIEPLNYRPEKVVIIGETGSQVTIPITWYRRPTLADTIFRGDILNNSTSDFSQIYVFREVNKIIKAYHLDITDPARVKLASKFEMRPDDVVFVATQPLSLYSRALSQLLGSAGLTFQARDTIRREIGN